ncbi:MAG: heme ABC transporter ATP-binding protein [Chloroflexota bacterium]
MSFSAENISVQVGSITIVQGVSLAIEPGKILALVGPNGAGKSTLLKALVREMRISCGTICINGRAVEDWEAREMAKIRAVLPQSSSLAFGFTVEEVILMGRTPHLRGVATKHDHAIIAEAMHLTHITHLAGRIYTTLSGGERQRVQLARVLAQIWEGDSPRYLLLDEPTNNLDLSHQHGTLTLARQFAERQVGVLTILHDLNLASQYADEVIVLKAGRVVSQGIPDAVFTPTTIQDTFGLPVMVQNHPCYDCPLIVPVPDMYLTEQPKIFHKETRP